MYLGLSVDRVAGSLADSLQGLELDLTTRTAGRACEAVADNCVECVEQAVPHPLPWDLRGFGMRKSSTQTLSTGTLHKPDEAVLTGRSSHDSGDRLFGRCEDLNLFNI